jgi:hypothetical protein
MNMKKNVLLLVALFCTIQLFAQLKVENVYSVKLRNSGAIITNGQVSGYYFFYQSDKIDKHTNEYTVQVVDENLNKVQDIKFQDNRKIILMEAAYNGSSLAFLFKNEENETLDMKIYSLEGKLKFTYVTPIDEKSEEWMKMVQKAAQADNGMNNSVFDLGERGYMTMIPVRDGKERSFEARFYNAQKKKHYTYRYNDDVNKLIIGEYIGCTDSLAFFTVMKRKAMLGFDLKKSLLAINFVTNRRAFEMTPDIGEVKFTANSVLHTPGSGKITLIGGYYEKDENVTWDAPQGLAAVEIDSKGNVLNTAVNSWQGDFSKYLPTDSKGRFSELGFLFIHKVIPTPDGGYVAVGEGFRKKLSAAKIALTAVSGYRGVNVMEVTDLVLMKFDNAFSLKGADVFAKTNNTVDILTGPDMYSAHMMAMNVKYLGGFDYEFTTGEPDNATFNICFSDYVKNSEYKGRTFNTIRFNGVKYSTDKIELKSKASEMRVLPAKSGFVMIYEYFKKTKTLELRIEKLG